MGNLFGGGKSTPGTTTTNPIPGFAQPYLEDYFKRASSFSQDPSQFAPTAFTAEQESALTSLANPTMNPEAYQQEIAQYQNPYDQMVLGETLKELSRANEGILSDIGSRATASGGFGGTRQAVLEGEAYKNLLDTYGQQTATLKAQGYRDALGQRRQGILDTLSAGGTRQQQQQQTSDADLQALQFLGQALGQIPGIYGGGTTSGTSASYKPSGLEQLAGIASIGASIFSDKRLKENVEYAFDLNGHRVYRFTYRDDNTKTKFLGVMAQEIQENYPHAVSLDESGYLTVNYDQLGIDFVELNNGNI